MFPVKTLFHVNNCCVCVEAAGFSEEAANVPIRPSDLHTSQRVHLRQPQVLRVTTSQVGLFEHLLNIPFLC